MNISIGRPSNQYSRIVQRQVFLAQRESKRDHDRRFRGIDERPLNSGRTTVKSLVKTQDFVNVPFSPMNSVDMEILREGRRKLIFDTGVLSARSFRQGTK